MTKVSGEPYDAPSEPLWRLVYSSSAVADFDEAALRELAAKAAERNKELGLSGTLLFRSAVFMQVLEGPRQAVDFMGQVIEADPRHAWMTRLVDHEIEHRMYEHWGMDLVFDLESHADWLAQHLQSIAQFCTQLSAMDPDLTTAALLHYYKEAGDPGRTRKAA